MTRIPLHWQILIAIVAAFVAGSLTTPDTSVLGIPALSAVDFIGTLFLNGLTMIIVPLVLSSIICGVSGMGSGEDIGRLGAKTLGFYLLSSLAAILIGLAVVNTIQPGYINGESAGDRMNLVPAEQVAAEIQRAEGRDAGDIVEVFLRMVPPNIVAAASEGQMLGIIFFGLLFGYFMTRVAGAHKQTLLDFWQAVFDTMMGITMFIMKFAPIGVFGLVAETIANTGFEAIRIMGWFFVTVVIALGLHIFLTLPLVLRYVARVSPLRHYRAMAPAMLTAFSTASSSGTLPLTMECVEKNAGVSNRTSSFVLPLGATVNMDGTALYECVAVIFIAQAYGADLSFASQLTVVIIALLTSIGVAGIPAASLVAIMVIMTALDLPLELVGLLMVTDRLLDMMRTAVNVFSDSCAAVVIAKSEGEQTVLTGPQPAAGHIQNYSES
ncbi:dicarboxylate/amino acid:cation symporter [Gilvimarinus sp. F26214L]|uniref:dicarboxylate/amino acid:cation symporter n=1 Tax=Gilvimarinus sp. DZF01 TaxID=3461371 RepID=UPI0040462F25